ncbi:MAG: hypothetical protein ACYDCL_06055 [Myxococcales bacterium]
MADTNELNPKEAVRDLEKHLSESLKAVDTLRKEVFGELDHLKHSLGRSAEATKTLRDEARVEIRLARMEAKKSWAKIAKQAGDAERRARHEMSLAATRALDEAADRMRAFLRSIRRDGKSADHPESR